MNWRDKIVTDWPNDLQKAHRCRTALQDLERALLDLAGLGHPLHVEEGYLPPPPPGWPRAMFHLTEPARSIHCQGDLDELGDGWYPTMEEARNAKGLQKQYERGGIFNRALPTMLTQTPQQIAAALEETMRLRDQQKKFVDDMRAKHRTGVVEGRIILSDEALHNGPEPGPDIPEPVERIGGRR